MFSYNYRSHFGKYLVPRDAAKHVLTICWRSCTESELFITCLTPSFSLRSKCFFVCLFVFCLIVFCLVDIVLPFKDRGFLNKVPIMLIASTATIVVMSAAWAKEHLNECEGGNFTRRRFTSTVFRLFVACLVGCFCLSSVLLVPSFERLMPGFLRNSVRFQTSSGKIF